MPELAKNLLGMGGMQVNPRTAHGPQRQHTGKHAGHRTSRFCTTVAPLQDKDKCPWVPGEYSLWDRPEARGCPRPLPRTAVPEVGHRKNPIPAEPTGNLWPSPTGCPLSACPGLSAPCQDLEITLLVEGAHSGAGRGRGEYRSGKPCTGRKGGTAISLEQDPCGPQLGARRQSRRHTLCGCSLGPREARGTGTESAWRVTAAGSSCLLRPHSAGASPCLPPSTPCSGDPDSCGIPPHPRSHSSLASRRRPPLPAVTGRLGTADPSLPDPGVLPRT